MDEHGSELVRSYQNVLGRLQCELLYISNDIDGFSYQQPFISRETSMKLALIVYCIECANKLMNEQEIANLITSRNH